MIRLKFQIDYYTTWGQQVCICGSIPEMGNFNENKALVLSPTGDNKWLTELTVSDTASVEYYYFIREGGGTVERREWGENRVIPLSDGKLFEIEDHWKDKPYHHYLYSSVFTESVFARENNKFVVDYKSGSVLLNVLCPYVGKDESLVLSGEGKSLGNWQLERALPLKQVATGEWQILINTAKVDLPAAYKFVIIRNADKKAVRWEDGENRLIHAPEDKKAVKVEAGILFRYAFYTYKGTGVSIPVFSLRSDESYGIGDFLDLKKMIDWAAITGHQIIQVLPINDTTTTKTWRDSYPYSAISIYALHPIYLSFSDFPLTDKTKQAAYLREAKKLNALQNLDYEKVLNLKMRYYRDLFNQDHERVFASEAYLSFCEKNKHWLFPYSCYCYLRDRHNTARFNDWGEFAVYDKSRLEHLLQRDAEAKTETGFNNFIQFLLHEQLSGVKEYAHLKGVALKGDIPIGIDRDSVDAWTNAHLFNMDTQTGAPPDDFSITGQNWGFPTYNWRAMEREDYQWWQTRFTKMADYFDAYRIDHILGFFRIWEIPEEAVQGLLGHFSPALPYYAEEIMRAGIPFDEERMTKPFIHEDFLPDFFGEYAAEAKEMYLSVSGWQRFQLKSFCDTQAKIKNIFEEKTDEKSIRLKNGLLGLSAEVLFLRDRIEHYKFHPRITAQYTYSYRYLNDHAKNAFNALYNDFYYRKHNYFWREQAMKKLPKLINSTSMMVCGEDLGMVPDCVPSVMNELQILSLEIQRMPKNPNTLFTDLAQLPYLSVCTTSTHDMSPIRAWWQENKELTQRYYNSVLGREGAAPGECSPELCREILQKHLASSAMWVILPWQDWMSIDGDLRNPDADAERINIPANPEHYWQYRMHISLDDLLKMDDLNAKIGELSRRAQ